MIRTFYHIINRTLGILLVLLAVAPAAAQIMVDQCDTIQFSVVSRPNIDDTHFVWGIYNASNDPTDILDPTETLDPALYFVDGMYASGVGRSVRVVNLGPGKYYLRIHVWDEVSCTDNIEMHLLEVIETIPDMVLYGDSLCIGEPATVRIVFTGLGPYKINYSYGDELTGNYINVNGTVEGREVVIPLEPLPVGPSTFWIISIEDGCKAYEFPVDERPKTGVLIYPKPVIKSPIYLRE